MGYHHLDVDDLEPTPGRPCERRSISETCELENVAANRYTADPGEEIPLAYHYHDEQEEVFYVLSGELAVETPDETFYVGVDEALVVEPESPQYAYNPEDADRPVQVLAIGAPSVDDAHAYDP